MTFKFNNVKPDNNYKRISNGDVFTGQQLRNLLELARPEVQAMILLDVQETEEEAGKPGKYGV